RRDTVTDRKLADIAVLEIGDPLVPLGAFEPAEVRAWDKRLLGCNLDLCLEGKRGVTGVVWSLQSPVDEEHGHGARAIRNAPVGGRARAHRRSRDGNGETTAIRDGHFVGSLGNRDGEAGLPLRSPPEEEAALIFLAVVVTSVARRAFGPSFDVLLRR